MAPKPRPAPPPRAAIGEFSPGRKLSAVSMEAHPCAGARGALVCGLHDATIVADQIAAEIEWEHTVRGRLTKRGVELRDLAKRIADSIWAVRQEVEVPHG